MLMLVGVIGQWWWPWNVWRGDDCTCKTDFETILPASLKVWGMLY